MKKLTVTYPRFSKKPSSSNRQPPWLRLLKPGSAINNMAAFTASTPTPADIAKRSDTDRTGCALISCSAAVAVRSKRIITPAATNCDTPNTKATHGQISTKISRLPADSDGAFLNTTLTSVSSFCIVFMREITYGILPPA